MAAGQDVDVDRYRDACALDDGAACVTLGLIYESGPVGVRDAEAAVASYQRACDLDVPRGCTSLGLMLEAGTGTNRDVDRAAELFGAACGDGEELGCDRLRALEEAGLVAPAGPMAVTNTMITGRVVDALTRSVLSEAIVTVPRLGVQALTGPDGRFWLDGLPPGSHVMRVERFGYAAREIEVALPGSPDLLLLMSGSEAGPGDGPGRIVGRVTETGGNRGLSDVDVTVVGRGRTRTLSNNQGRFTLRDVAPGLVTVRFERLGYEARSTHLVLQAGGTVQVAASLAAEAIELEPIEVTVINSWLQQRGFYSREQRGLGSHFDRRALDELNLFDVSDILWRVPGVRVRYDVNQAYALGRGGCRMRIFVDDVPWLGSDINVMPPEWLEAVEIYRGVQTPIQYRGSSIDPCGVILIWTRRGA